MQDQIRHAPMDGAVQQLAVHTVGGVVTPAQVPPFVSPPMTESKSKPWRSTTTSGSSAPAIRSRSRSIRSNFTKYGLLHDKVVSLSGDAIVRDKNTAQSDAQHQLGQIAHTSEPPGQELLYSACVALDETKMQVEDRIVDLAPSMAVTAEIKTGRRRIMLSPLLRYQREAGRER
ncbi:hypothetical protein [Bradyrhizobium sp. BR13661]|jgi:hemolysin D|uniref:hypothetical protein n=1 Tax=Bradyrhizobium sp. BR13661 TaxID=2940622 RepID=UPI002475DB4E|nr:hypothetical protein [Bradyrhizobium sp. BR13661]MDH6260861.1 hypothetical protein [Bradyrhizobium sp. BR13661]